MERIRFVQHHGSKILLEDFSGLAPGKEFMETLDAASKIIATQPAKSVLALLDATNAHYDGETLSALQDFVKANTPFIKAASVVGIGGLSKIALNAITRFSGRTFGIFNKREEAMEWLVKQP
jgi:hypothetical protein